MVDIITTVPLPLRISIRVFITPECLLYPVRQEPVTSSRPRRTVELHTAYSRQVVALLIVKNRLSNSASADSKVGGSPGRITCDRYRSDASSWSRAEFVVNCKCVTDMNGPQSRSLRGTEFRKQWQFSYASFFKFFKKFSSQSHRRCFHKDFNSVFSLIRSEVKDIFSRSLYFLKVNQRFFQACFNQLALAARGVTFLPRPSTVSTCISINKVVHQFNAFEDRSASKGSVSSLFYHVSAFDAVVEEVQDIFSQRPYQLLHELRISRLHHASQLFPHYPVRASSIVVTGSLRRRSIRTIKNVFRIKFKIQP